MVTKDAQQQVVENEAGDATWQNKIKTKNNEIVLKASYLRK